MKAYSYQHKLIEAVAIESKWLMNSPGLDYQLVKTTLRWVPEREVFLILYFYSLDK